VRALSSTGITQPALLWRVHDYICCAAADKLRLIPGAAALLVSNSANYNRAPRWRKLLHHGANYCGSCNGRGGGRGSRSHRMVTTAAAIITAVNVNIAIYIDILVDVYVPVNICI